MDANIENQMSSENEVNLMDLGKKLWKRRKFILKVSLVGLVVGVVIAFSIPKEYTTTVILAPEGNSSSSAGGVGALAAMAGVNLGEGTLSEGQMAPDLYPNIVESTPFILGLFDVRVKDIGSEIDTTLYSYIENDQRNPWWYKIVELPRNIIGLFSTPDPDQNLTVVNPFELTREQTEILDDLKSRITVTVDKKTGIITLSSTMQSPQISAFIADTLTSYLQSYIINYRTQKARQDLFFTEKLYLEAKNDYLETQRKLARFLDGNLNVVSASYRVDQEKLQNETALAYSVYNQMANQLQMAKVKVQDTTPVYTVIQPATVPLIPIKPNKKLIVIGFAFLAVIGICAWYIGKEYLKNDFEIKD
ncbi:chain-length determining protein [Dysgonomonas sp. HDW5A]|uniref:Wzz/FepE/Etk N-terminal domain-containing protein n=1 Tax=Dysgonomonas sp. HDW5A TaxID=2714926 RepID=UPI0014073733|nr:Wzz/FepE/Etk N-terminal domain-containing protein [Dysgonomonas sp. HDW5A]QIK59601.1 chain-length determining protein [Dysgonomonas sp. HDW5A]